MSIVTYDYQIGMTFPDGTHDVTQVRITTNNKEQKDTLFPALGTALDEFVKQAVLVGVTVDYINRVRPTEVLIGRRAGERTTYAIEAPQQDTRAPQTSDDAELKRG